MPKKIKEQETPHYPFQEYMEQLIELFQQAHRSRNAALFLYHHDARTPFFMAESLMRLLNRLDKDERTAKWLKILKKLEDILGKIDYWDQLIKHVSKIKAVKEKQVDYFITQRDKELQKLNKRLARKDFYLPVLADLLSYKVNFNNKQLILGLKKEIQNEVRICYEFYKDYPKAFTNLENQVHEIRRKLRWISIYAQSLQGIMVLKPISRHYAWEKEFVTRTSKHSQFNTLVIRKSLKEHISVNRTAFYALVFVIDALGELKDKGLILEAFEKMLKKTSPHKKTHFEEMAVKQLKLPYASKDILKEAHELLHNFFIKGKIHQELL